MTFPAALDTFADPRPPGAGQFVWLDGTIRDKISGADANILVAANPDLVHSTLTYVQGVAIEALQSKVGIDSTGSATSIDYLLKNPLSINPGHKHTTASLSGNISVFTNNSGYITSAGAPVQSVANGDGTITISPTAGAVIASLALGNANTWTGKQTFNNATTQINGTLGLAQPTTLAAIIGNLSGNARGSQAIDIQTSHIAINDVASGQASVCLGTDNKATNTSAIAIGTQNSATNTYTVAIGKSHTVSANYAVGIGFATNVSGAKNVAIGTFGSSSGSYNISLGTNCTVSGFYNSSVGSFITNSSYYGAGVGAINQIKASNTVGIGNSASCYASNGIAIGQNATVGSSGSGGAMAFGLQASVNAIGAVAIGTQVNNNVANTVNIGNLAVLLKIGAAGVDNSTAGPFRMAGVSGIGTNASPTSVALAKLTVGGTNGSITVIGGIITAYSAPT